MHSRTAAPLTVDEIDDLLYFTRMNESQDLHQTLSELTQKYSCMPAEILSACVDPTSGNTILHYCSANGFAELLQTLLAAVKDTRATTDPAIESPKDLIDRANNEGNTPLHWAAYNGHVAVVKLLVAERADMWKKNAAGHLAMFEAERAEKSEVVQFLLEAGGREVERAGTEKQPTNEDIADVQNGESSTQAAEEIEASMVDAEPHG